MKRKLTSMGGFRVWFEARQENLGDSLDLVLGALDLDRKGSTTPLSSLKREVAARKIKSLERYGNLPERRRRSVDSALESEDATVLDVAKAMSGYGMA